MMTRLGAALLALAAAGQLRADGDALDPAFQKIPFDQWLSAGDQAAIRWTAHVSSAQLSNHQRLRAQVALRLDGADLASRRAKGELRMFVQISDSAGRRYQDHGSIDLQKLEDAVRKSYLDYTQSVFLLPGEYRLSAAIYDTATDEHSIRQERFRIPVLKNDPLPQAWRDLPPVEFIGTPETPAVWYLPEIRGRLRLPTEAQPPVRIEVVVNLTPSRRAAGSNHVQDRNLSVLVPAMKVISMIEIPEASWNIAILDLSRRREVFQQNDAHVLDWERMGASLAEINPGIIDVKSLQDRHRNAEFFVDEIRRRLAPDERKARRVVIVLSSPVEFEPGEDLQPIPAQASPDTSVFYFRFHVLSARQAAGFRPSRHGPQNFPARQLREAPVDQLEPTLKPLAPRLFDIETPEQFRKALAVMLAELGPR